MSRTGLPPLAGDATGCHMPSGPSVALAGHQPLWPRTQTGVLLSDKQKSDGNPMKICYFAGQSRIVRAEVERGVGA